MAQSDQTIQNAAFPAVRADINDNLAAIYSQNSGASAPSTTVAFQPWVDTSSSPPVWKIRNAANSAWITVGVLDPTGFQIGGVTPIASGGTGQTTVAAAIAALLPSQTGNADKALVTNGASLLWSVITSSSFTKYTFAAGSGTGSTRTHTWTKPSSGTAAIVLIWGSGGGGGKDHDSSEGGCGGGGGGCSIKLFQLSDLGSTETITLGLGGEGTASDGSGSDGRNSTFGSHLTGQRGQAGDRADETGAFGGNGGGVNGYGITNGGGRGSEAATVEATYLQFLKSSTLGGGGGGAPANGGSADQNRGGDSFFGGGGGGGYRDGGGLGGNGPGEGAGGASIFGGNGGTGKNGNADNGSTPGGGGGGTEDGASGSGGDGECWVLIF